MRRINERYREFIEASADPAEARRRVVECARRHGTAAAARMSGAGKSTVSRLLRRSDAGHPVANDPSVSLSREDEARIIDARMANPNMGVRSLKKRCGLPHGTNQINRVLREAGLAIELRPPTREEEARIIDARMANPNGGVRSLKRKCGLPHGRDQVFRVLHEAGLVRKIHIPTRDPDYWLRRNKFLLMLSTIDFCLAAVASLKGMTGGVANTDPPLHRLQRAARRLEWWKREKERVERERLHRQGAKNETATAFDAEHAKNAEDGTSQGNEGPAS